MEGPDALDEVVGQLEGFEAPAGAWETEILPARLAGYEPAWLDDLAWPAASPGRGLGRATARPNGSERGAAPVRTTPITLLARRHAALWASLSREADAVQPSPRAQTVADFLRAARRLVLRRDRRGHAACCAPRSRRRWPSSSPSAW